MKLYIYVNYLKDGGMSFGFSYEDETRHVKITDKDHPQFIPAYYDLWVNDEVELTIENILDIVKEAITSIGHIPYREIIDMPCKKGHMQILVREGYPETVEDIQGLMIYALEKACKDGKIYKRH